MPLIIGLIGVVFLGAIRWNDYGVVQILAVLLVLWLANSAFSIFASPILLRYQVFPLLIAFYVGAVLMENTYKLAR